MIDDERLQELLSKASSLYNNGEYKGAIEAWREALTVDPSSQKAREGIRMATLLVGDWGPNVAGSRDDEVQATADGAEQEAADLSPEEEEAKLDLGIARLKQLVAQRKFSEAVEGARGLLKTHPGSDEIQRLLEEAQHAFESAPFIEEHLTLARELMAQERFPEAETECKKIFALDEGHPDGRALLAQIRKEIQSHLSRAADQLGGMTVKMNLKDLKGASKETAAEPNPQAGGATAQRPAKAPSKAEEPKRSSFDGELVLDGDDAPPIALAGQGPPNDGSEAVKQEDVAARSVLDAAFAQAGFAGEADPDPAEPAGSSQDKAPKTEAEPHTVQPQTVQAKTIVPPTVRLAPRTTDPQDVPSPEAPRPQAAEQGPGAPGSSGADPGIELTPSLGSPPSSGNADETSWETELAQLNIKQGQSELLRGTPATMSGAGSSDSQADADLMSILDNDLGGIPGPQPPAAPSSAREETAPGGPDSKSGSQQTKSPAEKPAPSRETGRQALRERESPSTVPRERPKPSPLPKPAPRRSSGRKYVVLLLFLLLSGGAGAFWFFYQPRSAGGAGVPGQPGSKQGPGDPSHAPEQAQGGIPTPIGSTSKQPPQEARASTEPGNRDAAQAPDRVPALVPDGAAAPPAGGLPHPTGGASQPAPAPGVAVTPQAPGGPIKPAMPPLSAEEIRRKVATYMDEARKLMDQSRWREARAKLSAALAIDPANFDVKDLLDRTQSKLDDQQHIDDDFDAAKKFYTDKDYENALRKFYRLPRDKGLGDIDLYIRNSWFNWAVTSMKAGNATDALVKLKELLDVDPDDAQALKLQEVAEHYVSRAKDRVYYAFTDSLKLRAFDQK